MKHRIGAIEQVPILGYEYTIQLKLEIDLVDLIFFDTSTPLICKHKQKQVVDLVDPRDNVNETT